MISGKIRLCQTNVLLLALVLAGSEVRGEAWRAARNVAEAPAAQVVSVNGRVRSGSRYLKPGDALMVGEVVRAEEGSGAKLLLADKSILDVSPSSSVKIESFAPNSGADREVEVGVETGRVRASIKKKLEGRGKFLIRTRASVLAVRGTELVVDVGPQGSSAKEIVLVKEGSVFAELAGGGGKVTIPEGRRLETQAFRSGNGWAVRPTDFRMGNVDRGELTGTFNQATVVDRSFLQGVQIRENDSLFKGRETVQALAVNFKPPPPLPASWKPDPGQLLRDQTPTKPDSTATLRRPGADQSIDAGGNNVTEVNVSVIFKP